MKKLLIALVLLGLGLVGQSYGENSALSRGYKAVTSQEKLAQKVGEILVNKGLLKSITDLQGHANKEEMVKCPGLTDARKVISGLGEVLQGLNEYGVLSKEVSVKIDAITRKLNSLSEKFSAVENQLGSFSKPSVQSSSTSKDKLQQMETKSGQLKQEAKTLNQNATALKEQQKKEAEKSWTQTAKEMFGLGKKDK